MSLLPYLIGPGEFVHYAMTTMREIAWLSESEYRSNSLARRASYSYLNEIVEGASKLVELRLKSNGLKAERSYRKRFSTAGRKKILPKETAKLLGELAVLRNLTTHDNLEVNAELKVFPRLIEMVAVGFSLSEFLRCENCSDLEVLVDREYLISRGSITFRDPSDHQKKQQFLEAMAGYSRNLTTRIC